MTLFVLGTLVGVLVGVLIGVILDLKKQGIGSVSSQIDFMRNGDAKVTMLEVTLDRGDRLISASVGGAPATGLPGSYMSKPQHVRLGGMPGDVGGRVTRFADVPLDPANLSIGYWVYLTVTFQERVFGVRNITTEVLGYYIASPMGTHSPSFPDHFVRIPIF